MPIVQIIVTLAVLGVVLWLINTYIPMYPPFKTVINIIVVVLLCIWLLEITGVMAYRFPGGLR